VAAETATPTTTADRVTATAASRTGGLVAVALAAVVLVAVLAGGGQSSHRRPSGPFAWLHPASPPASWNVARSGGGALPYPPGWTRIKTDSDTASVALLGAGHRIDGYLNATPRQGTETLGNWSRFRPAHNGREGDRSVRVLAASSDLTFRSGRGACVIDEYTTSKATYREIACLVSGPRAPAVVVAAAPTAVWKRQAATLERAVSSFVP
jgi:hypothetical protein